MHKVFVQNFGICNLLRNVSFIEIRAWQQKGTMPQQHCVNYLFPCGSAHTKVSTSPPVETDGNHMLDVNKPLSGLGLFSCADERLAAGVGLTRAAAVFPLDGGLSRNTFWLVRDNLINRFKDFKFSLSLSLLMLTSAPSVCVDFRHPKTEKV